MRPIAQILIGGVCMLIGMLHQHIPGIQVDASWHVPMSILFVAGMACFYFGFQRAARLAEKAYYTSKESLPKSDRAG